MADFSSQHAESLPAKHRLGIHFLAHSRIHHSFPTPRELFCPQQLGSNRSALELCHRAVSLPRLIRALPLLYKGPPLRGIGLSSTGFPSFVGTANVYTPFFDYVSISQLAGFSNTLQRRPLWVPANLQVPHSNMHTTHFSSV